MKAIMILLSVPFLMVASFLCRGYVLSKMWLWFVASTFNLPAISIPNAIGLAVIVSFLTYELNETKGDEKSPAEQMARACVIAFIAPALVLLVGFITKQWM